ncbi:MAG: hypothetical protein AAF900_01300 [Bacteroidota bacterium]
MNKSNLTKVGTFFSLLLIVSVVGYNWYHHRRAEQAKKDWHYLENSLDHNADIHTKLKHYKDFIKVWAGTPSSSTACYLVGQLYMQTADKDYDNAIKYLTMAKFTKGSILDAERHTRLATCYQHTDKLEKALTAYEHVIAHAPAYGCKIEALWAKANIYATGRLQNQAKRCKTLQQITEIPLDGINEDESSLKIIYTAESILESISPTA